jgi:hypothetical protein
MSPPPTHQKKRSLHISGWYFEEKEKNSTKQLWKWDTFVLLKPFLSGYWISGLMMGIMSISTPGNHWQDILTIGIRQHNCSTGKHVWWFSTVYLCFSRLLARWSQVQTALISMKFPSVHPQSTLVRKGSTGKIRSPVEAITFSSDKHPVWPKDYVLQLKDSPSPHHKQQSDSSW